MSQQKPLLKIFFTLLKIGQTNLLKNNKKNICFYVFRKSVFYIYPPKRKYIE